MKRITFALWAALLGLALVSGAWAEKKAKPAPKVKPVEITCQEFLALDPGNKARIAYWIDGYLVEEGEAAEYHIAMDKSDHPVAALVGDCKKAPTAKVVDKAKE